MTVALAGLVAGFVHVFSGPDHLAAIAPFAVNGRMKAWRTGVRWGLGHTAGVLTIAVLALVLRHALVIDNLWSWGEQCVGFAMIGIGIWGVRTALARHKHGDRHNDSQPHSHGHAAFAMGTLHGLAGSSHVLGIVVALALPSDLAAATYLLLFGAGSVAAMGTFSSVVGWISGRPGPSSVANAQAVLLGLSSVVAVVVGSFWIVSDLNV